MNLQEREYQKSLDKFLKRNQIGSEATHPSILRSTTKNLVHRSVLAGKKVQRSEKRREKRMADENQPMSSADAEQLVKSDTTATTSRKVDVSKAPLLDLVAAMPDIADEPSSSPYDKIPEVNLEQLMSEDRKNKTAPKKELTRKKKDPEESPTHTAESDSDDDESVEDSLEQNKNQFIEIIGQLDNKFATLGNPTLADLHASIAKMIIQMAHFTCAQVGITQRDTVEELGDSILKSIKKQSSVQVSELQSSADSLSQSCQSYTDTLQDMKDQLKTVVKREEVICQRFDTACHKLNTLATIFEADEAGASSSRRTAPSSTRSDQGSEGDLSEEETTRKPAKSQTKLVKKIKQSKTTPATLLELKYETYDRIVESMALSTDEEKVLKYIVFTEDNPATMLRTLGSLPIAQDPNLIRVIDLIKDEEFTVVDSYFELCLQALRDHENQKQKALSSKKKKKEEKKKVVKRTTTRSNYYEDNPDAYLGEVL